MYEIFEQLLQANKISAYKLAKETGISQTTLSNWKSGRSIPKQDKLEKIADYFGVTIDYLMGKESKKHNVDEKVLLEAFINTFPSISIKALSVICKRERINRDITEKFISNNTDILLDTYLNFENGGKDICVDDLLRVLLFLNLNIFYIIGFLTGALTNSKTNDIDLDELLSNAIRDGLLMYAKTETFEDKYNRLLDESCLVNTFSKPHKRSKDNDYNFTFLKKD